MRSLSLLVLLLWLPVVVRAEQSANQVYARAIEALNSGDCAKGSAVLRQYQGLAAETLARKPKFAAEVDKQIRDCDAAVIAGQRNVGPIIFQGSRKLDP